MRCRQLDKDNYVGIEWNTYTAMLNWWLRNANTRRGIFRIRAKPYLDVPQLMTLMSEVQFFQRFSSIAESDQNMIKSGLTYVFDASLSCIFDEISIFVLKRNSASVCSYPMMNSASCHIFMGEIHRLWFCLVEIRPDTISNPKIV